MKQLLLLAQLHIDGLPQVRLDYITIANVVSATFVVAGGMSVLFIIIGAIRYAISAGDQNQITQAKNTILYSLIGLVISLSAFTVVQFVLGRLNS